MPRARTSSAAPIRVARAPQPTVPRTVPGGKEAIDAAKANPDSILFGATLGSTTQLSPTALTLVGILPAAGGSIANILSYDQAKKASKHAEAFGKGESEGIIAAESANNLLAGGALVPTLAFGMPGDAATAVMLGALILHGIEPGPLLCTTQPGLSYGIIPSYLVVNVLMFVILSAGLKAFTQVFRLPGHLLFPYVLIFCAIGSLALHHRVFDIWVLFGFGVLGTSCAKGDSRCLHWSSG